MVNNAQIFAEILKSLGESLRSLVTRVELMERNNSDLSKTYTDLKQDLFITSQQASQLKEHVSEIKSSVTSTANVCDKNNTKLDNLLEEINQLCGTAEHLDEHMDGNESKMSTTSHQLDKLDQLDALTTSIEKLSKQLEPVSWLAHGIKKPIVFAIFLYLVIMSLFGLNKTATLLGEWGSKSKDKQDKQEVHSSVHYKNNLTNQSAKVALKTEP